MPIARNPSGPAFSTLKVENAGPTPTAPVPTAVPAPAAPRQRNLLLARQGRGFNFRHWERFLVQRKTSKKNPSPPAPHAPPLSPHPRPLSPEYRGDGRQEFRREAASLILAPFSPGTPGEKGWG